MAELDLPAAGSLPERIFARLRADPERPALAFADARGQLTWSTAGEVQGAAAGCARVLAAAGLDAGAVAVLVTQDPRIGARAVLGVLALGAVPLLVAPPAILGLNTDLGAVLRHVVRVSAAKVVLLPPEMAGSIAEIAAGQPSVSFVLTTELESCPPAPWSAVLPTVPAAGATAALQLTSGTTGFPRICVWGHEQVLAALDGMAQAMGLASDDVFVNWTPLYHDMGLVNNFFLALSLGLPLALLSPLDFIRRPVSWLRAIDEAQGTVTWSPNFGYAVAAQRIRDSEIDGVRLDRMRGFWNAGEKVHYETFLRFHERFARLGVTWPALKANFGCAENVGGATFTAVHGALVVERVSTVALHEERLARPVIAIGAEVGGDDAASQWVVSTGRAHAALEVRILDDDEHPLADGLVGQIALKTPSRLLAFLGQDEESAQVRRGELLLTGDLGYLRDGELFWVGRTRERINLCGLKHDPSDFESPLFAVAGLRQGCFAAFGVDDEKLGSQRLVILTELAESSDLSQPQEPVEDSASSYAAICDDIRREVATRLGAQVSEVALVARGTLTKTSSGKRRHLFFRDLYLAGRLAVLYSTAAPAS